MSWGVQKERETCGVTMWMWCRRGRRDPPSGDHDEAGNDPEEEGTSMDDSQDYT